MRFERSSGILLHPTSLAGPFGIGDLGSEAYRFIDFLALAGQRFWQVMPLSPPVYGGSPYASTSAFAGNINLVSPERLIESGLLTDAAVADAPAFPAGSIDHGKVADYKRGLLERAFQTFRRRVHGDADLRRDYESIVEPVAGWLDDYALFAALKDAYAGAEWPAWAPALARRDLQALARARRELADQIAEHRFLQYLFLRQWRDLKRYANGVGVRIIGDLPIFVAHDSADVWARPHLWQLRDDGRPTVVAGVPPDAFSATGQLWGNPLYAWQRLRDEGFAWWVDRVREALTLVDVVRLDHFRGFAACWEVPAADATAERGAWVEVPGRELLTAIAASIGTDLPLIAEDLGTITPDVHRLRDAFDLAGMRVLQFAFGGDPHDAHLPHEYPRHVAAYTGTHDNDTVIGWFEQRSRHGATEAERRERALCLAYLGADGREINWDFIRSVQMSVADVAIVPVQDVLGLGSSARMNTPGRGDGNWGWRLEPGALTEGLAERLRRMTAMYGRLPQR
jgi:4-alpha-glucanotransferase